VSVAARLQAIRDREVWIKRSGECFVHLSEVERDALVAVAEAAEQIACESCGVMLDKRTSEYEPSTPCLTCKPLRDALATLGEEGT
jgi:hypothetical protein